MGALWCCLHWPWIRPVLSHDKAYPTSHLLVVDAFHVLVLLPPTLLERLLKVALPPHGLYDAISVQSAENEEIWTQSRSMPQ